MLFYLYPLSYDFEFFSFLRLFKYVTFRAAGAALTAFLLTIILGPITVKVLKRFQATAPGHLDESNHEFNISDSKKKVPTMGGLLILFSITFSTIFWAIPNNPLVLVFLFLLSGLGVLGFVDDYQKVRRQDKGGISGNWKLVSQISITFIAVYLLHQIPETGENLKKLMFPFLKNPIFDELNIGVALSFSCLVVVASSNAVNLSDGLDGLAIGCTIICAITYAIFTYFCGHKIFANYLQIPYIRGCSEVVVIATSIAGAGMGFLWYNCPPASMFMGDTGSLSIGGAIGLIAVLVKQEILLLVVGGVFVIEAGSVILQVCYFKFTRMATGTPKRLFHCAPIHHHFQKMGWKEPQIVIRFWIMGLILAAVGLASLKIR